MHSRRGFTVAVISGLVISVLVGAGLAAEPPTATPLPDAGNGSRANGIFIDVIGAGVVVGSATGAGGVEHAVIWREDGDGSWRGRPLPGGINGSRANGIVIDFTGAGLVAGQATTAAGRTVPMVWRIDPDDGSATAAPLPIPAAAEGTANGILIDVTARVSSREQ